MPPKVTLTDVRGRSGELGGGIDSIGDKVEIVKITTGTFIKERHSDVWIEIVLGNNTNEEIMITHLDIQTNITVSDFNPGESNHISLGNSETAPLYYEEDTMPVTPSDSDGRNDGWNSMYKHSKKLGGDEPYFQKGSLDSSVKVFLHTLDSETFAQRVVTVPVSFNVDSHNETNFTCENFNTVSDDGEPVLLPKDNVRQQISEDNEILDEYVDAISFWVRFSTDSIPTYDSKGKFIFGLETASEFGPVRHTYHYYITPHGGEFNDSRKTPEVDYWAPADGRKMFEQWAEKYDVEKATQTGTGSSRQMIRVRNGIRDEESVTTRADYEIPMVKKIDEGVETYLNIVLAILGTLAIGAVGNLNQISPFVAMIIVFVVIFFVVLFLNLSVQNPITIYLWQIVRRL